MYRIRRVASGRYTADRVIRWAQPFTKRQLLHAARAVWPVLATLSFASVAHAQGTMDFSGATTLMSTFNVSTPAVQFAVEFSNLFQAVAEQSVCAIQCQREDVPNLQNRVQRGMFFGTEQVRQQVFGYDLASLVRAVFLLVRGLDLAKQFAEMAQGISNLTTGDMSVHRELVSS